MCPKWLPIVFVYSKNNTNDSCIPLMLFVVIWGSFSTCNNIFHGFKSLILSWILFKNYLLWSICGTVWDRNADREFFTVCDVLNKMREFSDFRHRKLVDCRVSMVHEYALDDLKSSRRNISNRWNNNNQFVLFSLFKWLRFFVFTISCMSESLNNSCKNVLEVLQKYLGRLLKAYNLVLFETSEVIIIGIFV